MTKRVFVSIDLPPGIKEKILREQVPGIYWIKWMNVKNFHITVSFLGDLRPDQIEQAKEVLSMVSGNFPKFSLTIPRFEGERDMLWALFERSESLRDLHDALKDEFRSRRLTKSERRGFVAHVLVGKSKTGRKKTMLPEKIEPLSFEANKINLYESELTPDSATNTLIQSFPLQ